MSKTYFLIGVLILVAFFNLFVLYNTQITAVNESYSIIRAGDLKTKVETIAGLAGWIANGKESDREIQEKEIKEFDNVLVTLKTGGVLRGQSIAPIPSSIQSDYDNVNNIWNTYRTHAQEIQAASIYNKDVVDAVNYVLGKNTELILTADALGKDLETLDRNYNRHREIAMELRETAKAIGQNALLVSLGQEEAAQENIHKSRLSFDVGMRKLLQIPLDDLDLSGLDIRAENLAPIPRENSRSLDELDLLWEAVELRVKILETKSLYSDEFDKPFSNLNSQRQSLLDSIDEMLDMWNEDRLKKRNEGQLITQSIIGVDIIIFIIVLFTIRKSLTPLQKITQALARVREGSYGEKIAYSSKDEIGELAASFNTMSETIMIKEEEARKIDIAKDEFLAMITHELKTPLVPIRGYADILLSGHLGNLTEKQKERISIIKSSAASLLQLISDLLDVQKLELGQLKLQKEPVNIQDTVAKSIQTLQPQIEEDKITVTNEVGMIIVPHDSDRITQVLTNLIKNSLKAVASHTGKIRIYSTEDQNEVKIMIHDNGSGIPQDRQAKLFTKFYQADASLTREKGGSGLGLSICKGIIEAHGGKISLASTPDSGTTVTFSLPKDKSPV
ncbi:MAG: HAMP domain-containing histidine kinase [Thaumarchaeota archaeon]|nr:HAMP domain-containing histidine kinase [Nitrososphaerota archaeon]